MGFATGHSRDYYIGKEYLQKKKNPENNPIPHSEGSGNDGSKPLGSGAGHGKWLKWLEKNVRFSRMNANRYMRVANEWEKCNGALHLEDALRLLTDDAETKAVLLEIDENLKRQDLNALEECCHLEERKKVWLALHPGTGQGKTPGKKGGKGGKRPRGSKDDKLSPLVEPDPFHKDTAKKTGQSPRTVQRKTEVGAKLSAQTKELLKGTKAEDRLAELQKIASLLVKAGSASR